MAKSYLPTIADNMPPSLISATIQSALLKATSNFSAQILSQWNADDSSDKTIDMQRVALFAAFGIVSSPMISWWQQILEGAFPTYEREKNSSKTVHASEEKIRSDTINNTNNNKVSNSGSRKTINWHNVAIKLILDQTIGQIVVNTTFIIITRYPQYESAMTLLLSLPSNLLTILLASWRLWPWVALMNFIFVPTAWRVLVTSLVGFGWNIFLSFLSSRM
ncbi:hypothetical protein V1520DRAFT_350751 [Lipomyces starkeyi]|uniref:Uncharacterized protein n=1 Tax=Lipomyces starkeyi NRRL Y-11557 TaxID=675824 RepID=A0A1E3PV06_LIPST|nr:hypothetical protein LIPSTDRAFT_76753 [Lipomyces starkeyi NRRL Y-11557]